MKIGKRELFAEFIEEWSQFFNACNWYTFHPIHFELEYEPIMGGVEMSLVILGIGFRIRFNYDTRPTEELAKAAEEWAKTLGKKNDD